MLPGVSCWKVCFLSQSQKKRILCLHIQCCCTALISESEPSTVNNNSTARLLKITAGRDGLWFQKGLIVFSVHKRGNCCPFRGCNIWHNQELNICGCLSSSGPLQLRKLSDILKLFEGVEIPNFDAWFYRKWVLESLTWVNQHTAVHRWPWLSDEGQDEFIQVSVVNRET